jgi:hypothetical protein
VPRSALRNCFYSTLDLLIHFIIEPNSKTNEPKDAFRVHLLRILKKWAELRNTDTHAAILCGSEKLGIWKLQYFIGQAYRSGS